jgi:hypothetical protein
MHKQTDIVDTKPDRPVPFIVDSRTGIASQPEPGTRNLPAIARSIIGTGSGILCPYRYFVAQDK